MRSFGLMIAGALGSALLAVSCCMPASAGPASARQATAAPQPAAPVRDGAHDFDFLYGTWLMHNRRLRPPVVTSHDWASFDATDAARPLPGGLGNEDFYRTDYPRKGFVGMTVRLYDRATGLWRIYWIDNFKSHGDAGAPNVGRWRGNVGIFDEPLLLQGKPAIDRYVWTKFGAHSRVTAHFAESLSFDGGKTWKLVFANDLIRSGPAAAASASAADARHGVIEPPVVGRFAGNVGVFKGADTFNGKPITVRFIWTVAPAGAKVVAKWQQAFSTDGGKTWEVNWRNQLIHDDHCRPTTPAA